MNKFFNKTILLLATITAQYIVASDYINYNTPSAHIANMFRYGNVETSLFTGRLNLSIPLYEMDDPDFALNIALRYNAEGFKPRKHSGLVGHDWFLEAGGCITREVRNCPDEVSRPISSGKHMEGMLKYLRNNVLDKDGIFAFSDTTGIVCNNAWNIGQDCSIDVDYLPDIFHFNFCGYKGSFMIDNKGKPVILTGDYLKIDLSELSEVDCAYEQSSNQLRPCSCTTISLTSKDGYKYVFGGDISSVSYTVSLEDDNAGLWASQFPPVINSWYLKKVIAPNDRQIIFHYRQPLLPYGLDRRDSLLELNEYNDLFATNNYLQYPGESPNDQHIKFNITKNCVLDSIVISDIQSLKIQFFNKGDIQSLYAHTHYNERDRPYMLDSIRIVSNNRILKRIALSYEYQSYLYNTPMNDAHYWRFLKNVQISGIGTYTLHYNHEAGTYPSLIASTNNGYYQVVDFYGFGKAKPLGGMLNRIDYPTGGWQKFTYERHSYCKERRYIIAGIHDVSMVTNDTTEQNLYGVRIKKVETYKNDAELVETQHYTYYPSHSSTSGSSGIYFNNKLVYLSIDNACLQVTDINTYSLLDTHIGYAYVEETTKDVNNNVLSKIGYTFDIGAESYSSVNNPDINTRQNPLFNPTGVYAAFSGMLAYNSKLTKVGHLLAKDYYRGNDIIRSELYRYNKIAPTPYHLIPMGRGELGNTDTIVVFSHRAKDIARKLYVCPDVIVQYVTQDYTSNSYPAFINKCYLYDKKLRVKQEYIRDRQNEWLFTKYSYPDEFPYQFFPPIRNVPSIFGALLLLNNQHRINAPLETVSGYEDANGDDYITAGKLYLYRSETLISLYSSISYVYLNRILNLALDKPIPIANYQPLSFYMEDPSYDSRYKTECEYIFNSNLRLIRVAPYGKIPTAYTWNGIYPATKTIGNQICTYSFIPYVGINSVTDARGVTTY